MTLPIGWLIVNVYRCVVRHTAGLVAAWLSVAVFLCASGPSALAVAPQQDISPDSSAQAPRTPAQDKPNIIFLLTDDQRADTLSIAGNDAIQTPHIDSLARQGVRYENAFTVAPICAPSRFALLSGQYERVSGLGFNSPYQVSAAQWTKTYPSLLREAGYYTGFIGKFGVQYYALPGGAEAQFDYWRAHDGWLPFFPKDLPGNPATQIYKNASADITTEIMGEYIEDFLRTRPNKKPFNLSVSFSAPHNSVVSSMYPGGADPACDHYACRVMGYPANRNPRLSGHTVYDALYRDGALPISSDTGSDPYTFIPRGVIDHKARQQWYAYNYDPALQPEHLVRYYQTITGIDKVIGALIEQLEDLSIADNTIIIFSSDHGLLNGEYGTGGKALLYDLVAKIPLVVFDPRRESERHTSVSDDLVLSIDIPATILRYAGLSLPEQMQGADLNANDEPRSAVFLESLTVAEGNPFIEAVRSKDFKYVRYFSAQGCPYNEEQLSFANKRPVFEQLFDLSIDPGERDNLVDSAEYASTLANLRQETQTRSAALTAMGRQYKRELPIPARPAGGVYCW